MSSGLALKSDPARILACTVSKNVHLFDLLIEDMEVELGDAWGDLSFDEARAFLDQPDAEDLEFLAIAVTADDDLDLGMVGELIVASKARGVHSILVAHDLGPAALHELLRLGADDFVPYPLAEGALHDAVERMRANKPVPVVSASDLVARKGRADRDTSAPIEIGQRLGGQAAVFAVQGIAGGTGASTLAVNLAWELANIDKQKSPSVCLLDLDLQAGTVSTYLDLPRRDMVIELLQDARSMDVDAFKQALLGYDGKLSVFPAPPELLPLDLIGPEEVEALIGFATQCFDVVVIDMPHSLVMWTETVLSRSDVYFTTMELDMRSAQNAMRFLKALRSEDLPIDKLNFVLNRAPGMTDLSGKTRVKKLAESLGIKIGTQLPDGGRQVMQAGDHGLPLMDSARKNPLRREITKLADGLHKAMLGQAATK
ncbi:AAA family ATPase [Rhodobacterales bacterium HKCCSP123]|nr:AAA family ATPase [Rhodobacterales bacterium HKCCSP123]